MNNCAAIYIEKGEHNLIRGCILWDCGNGLFCGHLTTDLVVEHNSIHGNGIEGNYYEHNNYTEAYGILFQFNHFGPLREECGGNNLKDRSAGCVIRYNWIESGNRQLDLVDSDYADFYDDPQYRETFVYGNVLVEPDGAGNSQILHYGGDSGAEYRYRKGTLYLHNNTILSTRSGNTTLARLSTNDETCDARNNIVYVTAPGNRLAMLSESGGILHLRSNWLKEGWTVCHGSTVGEVFDHGNVEGSDPGFDPGSEQLYELASDSDCVDAGTTLEAGIAAAHTPVMEYVRHALSRGRPEDGFLDIGAYEFAPGGAVDPPLGSNRVRIRAYPNPFARAVTLDLPAGARVSIVGIDGRLLYDSAAGNGGAGVRRIPREGASSSVRIEWAPPATVPPGVYFVRTGTGRAVRGCRLLYLAAP